MNQFTRSAWRDGDIYIPPTLHTLTFGDVLYLLVLISTSYIVGKLSASLDLGFTSFIHINTPSHDLSPMHTHINIQGR